MELSFLLTGEFIVFAILAIVTLVSTYQMVTVRLITHSALFMALTFTAVAGVFLLLQQEFIAAIQVLVYAGAITTMVIFAIMLSGLKDIKAEAAAGTKSITKSNPFVFVVGAIFAVFMTYVYVAAGLPGGAEVQNTATVEQIGVEMFTRYVIPFEIASVLLLIAMVGAIILTAKEAE